MNHPPSTTIRVAPTDLTGGVSSLGVENGSFRASYSYTSALHSELNLKKDTASLQVIDVRTSSVD